VGQAGVTLVPDGESRWRCPETGALFTETDGTLTAAEDLGTQGNR
jgi:UDP-2-acetamido-3-amino-2,3-dideoxy-glucuronate N-acetyltransferase